MHGYLEGVLHGEVLGWCYLPHEPQIRLEVEVLVDERPVARGLAALPRDGLVRASHGDGRYGFRIPLPAALADGGTHRLRAIAREVSLPPTPQFIPGKRDADIEGPWLTTLFASDTREASGSNGTSPGGTSTDLESIASQAPQLGDQRDREREPRGNAASIRKPLGYIDGIVADKIVGWVADPTQPEVSIPVEAYLDGVLVGASTAEESRGDVARQGYGERHGFQIPLDGALSEGEYLLEVRVADNGRSVPLASDYVVLDDRERAIEGVQLKTPLAHGVSAAPGPTGALLGPDGWLFEWRGTRVFDMLRGAEAMPKAVLDRQLSRVLARRDTVGAAKAALIEAVVPAKLAVYREQLPAGLETHDVRRPADELVAALQDENGVDVIDLAVALRHAKRYGSVFPRTGRDLTWLGGFYAYRCIAKELAKSLRDLEPLTRATLSLAEPEPVSDSLHDLAHVVWIGTQALVAGVAAGDQEREGQPQLDWSVRSVEYSVLAPELAAYAGSSPALMERRERDRGRDLLLIHDGAGARLAPFLAEHFDRTLIVAGDCDLTALLAVLKPAVVVEVLAETSLLY